MNLKTKKYQNKKDTRSAGFILGLYSNHTQTILTPYPIHSQVILGSYSFHIIAPLQIRFAYTLSHKILNVPKAKISIKKFLPTVIQFFFSKIITKTFGLRAPPFPKTLKGRHTIA